MKGGFLGFMRAFCELFQTADWKSEKHAPSIELDNEPLAGERFQVTVAIGKAHGHPNTTEHHIRWISVYFQPEGEKFPAQVGHFDFSAHGESIQGANMGWVYTHPEVTLTFQTDKSGTLYATSLCNIHGLWLSQKEIRVR